MLDHAQAPSPPPSALPGDAGFDGTSLNRPLREGIDAASTRLAVEGAALQAAAREFDAVVAREWHRLMGHADRYGEALREARAVSQGVAQLVDGTSEDLLPKADDPQEVLDMADEWRLALRDDPEFSRPAPVLLHMPDHAREIGDLPTGVDPARQATLSAPGPGR